MAGTPVLGIPKAPATPTLVALLTQKDLALDCTSPAWGAYMSPPGVTTLQATPSTSSRSRTIRFPGGE